MGSAACLRWPGPSPGRLSPFHKLPRVSAFLARMWRSCSAFSSGAASSSPSVGSPGATRCLALPFKSMWVMHLRAWVGGSSTQGFAVVTPVPHGVVAITQTAPSVRYGGSSKGLWTMYSAASPLPICWSRKTVSLRPSGPSAFRFPSCKSPEDRMASTLLDCEQRMARRTVHPHDSVLNDTVAAN